MMAQERNFVKIMLFLSRKLGDLGASTVEEFITKAKEEIDNKTI
jgi:hypothetical protein